MFQQHTESFLVSLVTHSGFYANPCAFWVDEIRHVLQQHSLLLLVLLEQTSPGNHRSVHILIFVKFICLDNCVQIM